MGHLLDMLIYYPFHADPADVEDMISSIDWRNGTVRIGSKMGCGLLHSAWVSSSMERSFESIRMGVKDVCARWLKASKALKKEDQIYGQKVAEMAKKHSSEAFYALDDPLEAAVFSVLVEMLKEMDKADDRFHALSDFLI
jgi:hypothetical protein